MNHAASVMARNLISQLPHVGAFFRHSNHLEASGYKGSDTDIFCQLPMPANARRGLVVFEVLCDVRVKRVVDDFYDTCAPPFWPACQVAFPACKPSKLGPQFIGKRLFPSPQFIGDECP